MAVDTEKLLNFTCEMGRSLLQNGAEIYRVEESLHLILRAYGYQQIEIFAIPSCIIINIQGGARNHNKAIRIKTAANNLHRLNDLNALCREICAQTPSVEVANMRLKQVMEEPTYPWPVSYLAHAIVTFFFTLFFFNADLLFPLFTPPFILPAFAGFFFLSAFAAVFVAGFSISSMVLARARMVRAYFSILL